MLLLVSCSNLGKLAWQYLKQQIHCLTDSVSGFKAFLKNVHTGPLNKFSASALVETALERRSDLEAKLSTFSLFFMPSLHSTAPPCVTFCFVCMATLLIPC